MTYTIKLQKNINKSNTAEPDYKTIETIEGVKGHYFGMDVPYNWMAIIFEDESRDIIKIEEYDKVKLSKEFFIIKAQQAMQQSQGAMNPNMINTKAKI